MTNSDRLWYAGFALLVTFGSTSIPTILVLMAFFLDAPHWVPFSGLAVCLLLGLAAARLAWKWAKAIDAWGRRDT